MSGGEAEDSPVEPILVSDAERQAAIERLNTSFSEGRLTNEEFSARLDEVYVARTDSELLQVTRGLPAATSDATDGGASKDLDPAGIRGVRAQVEQATALAVPGIITSAIWAADGAHGGFWPAWVWLGTGVLLLLRFRRNVFERNHPGHLGHHHQLQDRQPGIGWAPGQPGVGAPTVPTTPPVTPPVTPSGTAVGRAASRQRSVMTVVFADIVDSTGHATRLGDEQWESLLQRFNRVVDGVLALHEGHHVFTKGDEVVASFDSPDQGIRFAVALREAIRPLDLALHTGVHTGQVQEDSGQLSGISLHIGQRVSALSDANEILVSSTVRDITYGSGFPFTDRGEHELRGLEGQWHLYAVGSRGD